MTFVVTVGDSTMNGVCTMSTNESKSCDQTNSTDEQTTLDMFGDDNNIVV